MKLLHISDWHLGRTTYGASRAGDHEAVLDEMVDHARVFAPDLIVHTGDLFDSVRPAYDDLHRALDALDRLAELAPAVVLRGNHDSAALFSVFNRLGHPSRRVHFVERAKKPSAGGILDFECASGHRVRLASLPFVHANRMVDGFEDPKRWTSEYAKRIHTITAALGQGLEEGWDPERDVLVFAAHLHVAGATWSGSERPLHVGDHYASQLERLPTVSYAAFGHIHKPQALPGSIVTGAYAGSPLQLDFGEVGEQKSIVAVEAEPGQAPRIERIPLTRGRRLASFTGDLDALARAADELGDAICKLVIDTASPEPELSRRVRELVPRAEVVEVVERCAERRIQALDERAPADETREPGLDELLSDFLAENGTDQAPAERVLDTFRAALTAIEAEERPQFTAEDVFDEVDPAAATP
ncbi:metallophosphoesterase family protein [Haliangium sp.]|uniref:metallophosphoesterase family protein n=1 Tax=Haliangium sp. TaxID=2663208 RepID=UPI003D151825